MSHGPYETEQQARADCDWARRVPVAAGSHVTPNANRLLRACVDAKVDLGAYDWRIIDWLATWEAETVQVIAGLISRAYTAGQASTMAGQVNPQAYRLRDGIIEMTTRYGSAATVQATAAVMGNQRRAREAERDCQRRFRAIHRLARALAERAR